MTVYIFFPVRESISSWGGTCGIETLSRLTIDERQPDKAGRKIKELLKPQIGRWRKELAADLYGILLFGPAYFFAFAEFIVSMGRLDSPDDDHPPPRFRLRRLLEYMDHLYPSSFLPEEAGEYLDQWRPVANEDIDCANEKHLLLIYLFDALHDPEKLREVVMEDLGQHVYLPGNYTEEVEALLRLIVADIPPAEVLKSLPGEDGVAYVPADIRSILNAGWLSHLRKYAGFRQRLPKDRSSDEQAVALEFNAFLMKSMELNDIILTWNEEASDAING
ncbi:MAG: hypothetical protein HYV26_02125 [Candidatus Hydrogenedentes bacterium]|nr:hypothetical protein [Candidatus Hydrogenedentota bacterium]